MGTEQSPNHNPNKAGKPDPHALDLKIPPEVLERDRLRNASIEKIAARVAGFGPQVKVKPAVLAQEVRDAFLYSPNEKYDQLLVQTLALCLRLKIDPRPALSALSFCVSHEIEADRLHADHLVLYGRFEQSIRAASRPFQTFIIPEIRMDTARLLSAGVPPRLFKLYSELAGRICKEEQVLQRASDQISLLCSAMLDLLDAPFLEVHFSALQKTCAYEIKEGRLLALPAYIRAFGEALEFCSQAHAGERGAQLFQYFDGVLQTFMQRGAPLADIASALTPLLEQRPSDQILRSIDTLLEYHSREGVDPAELKTLIECVRDLNDEHGLPDLMSNYQQALQGGVVQTKGQSLALLRNLAAQSALHALDFATTSDAVRGYLERLGHHTGTTAAKIMSARPGVQEYMREQARFYRPLRSAYGEQILTSETEERGDVLSLLILPAQRALLGWRRLADLYLGFGALTYEARRLPSREPPLLARFGAEVGRMYYVNANDVNAFPGRGFAITNLELDRVFPLAPSDSSRTRDRYAAYKKAWPSYAAAFDEIAGAEFLYTRAMIAVSFPDQKRFGLPVHGKDVQYSLVVFNSHHANPTGRVAALIPTAALAAGIRGTLIPFADFRGFDSGKPDLNSVMHSAEQLLRAARAFGPVIPIGSPQAVTVGIFPDEHVAWGDYLDAFDKHLADVKEWDNAFRSRNRYELDRLGGYAQEVRLGKRAVELEAKREEVLNQMPQKGDGKLWDLTHRYLDLLDLMRVIQSRWHRGYTLGANLTSSSSAPSSDSEQGQELLSEVESEPRPPSTTLIHDSGEDVYLNRSALRMVHEAFAFHRMRENPQLQSDAFPILAVVDALNYARNPELSAYIDTYDWHVVIGATRVALSPDGLSMEDELFLAQHFLPRAADKPGSIGDLRFLNRRYVGIQ
ncbi:MAG: hypothetical protein J0M12_02230 [Deltaproteobacteria bacterium]|nr:hypothetical protein [Deltaproteobacteria bacterium]